MMSYVASVVSSSLPASPGLQTMYLNDTARRKAAQRITDYTRGIADVLNGENRKASCYVTHPGWLGTLREKIVGTFIRESTPDKFRVETGFIFSDASGGQSSPQCDLLVHDCFNYAPLYRWQDFVVVRSVAAKAAVEVKTTLDSREFGKIASGHAAIAKMSGQCFLPTFAYCLEGMTFDSLVNATSALIRQNPLGLNDDFRVCNFPCCIAVQSRQLIAVRPLSLTPNVPNQRLVSCVIDLGATKGNRAELFGIETGAFLEFYRSAITDSPFGLLAWIVYEWFNMAGVVESAMAWITGDGEVHRGAIPNDVMGLTD